MNRTPRRVVLAVAAMLALVVPASTAGAHCDTLNGPVVAAARLALQKGDVTPVLKWVKPADEAEIRHRFVRVIEARKHADHSVEAGREFVEAYVEYVHYVENVDLLARGEASGHTGSAQAVPSAAHSHK